MRRHSVNPDCSLLPYREENLFTMQDVSQRAGWEITAFNLPAAWQYANGEGVVVAVIDTGCDLDHEDLVNNLLPGKNFLNPNTPPNDDCGHGTHVTGIICAENNDMGVVGVAPKCKVIPIKVLDKKGRGNMKVVATAIRWAVDQKVDFITMSLGSPKGIPDVHAAIKYAASKNVVMFCAAGNAGKTRQIFYPAAYPETIGVGSIDESFDRSKFSCTGDDLDFLAPGGKILSTVPENWYSVMSGTSMANPFVVGVCALLLSFVRAHKVNVILNTAEDYRGVLKNYTMPIKNSTGQKFFEGFGIIDPRKFEEWVKKNV